MRLYMTELAVSDLTASISWWSQLLGIGPVLTDEAGGFALFEVDGGRVALKRGLTGGGGVVHFQVNGLPAGEVRQSDEGYRRVKMHDPDGNAVVLFEWVR